MADTLTAPAPSGLVAVPAPPVPSSAPPSASPSAAAEPPKNVQDANKLVRGLGDTWAGVSLAPSGTAPLTPPVDGMSVTDGSDGAEGTDGPPPESIPAPDEGPEYVQDEQGRWHRQDGTFATAEELAQIEAQLRTEAPSAPAEPETPSPEHVVTLRRRDGTTRDVIIEDPELAQEIRQNMNDGMRRREFLEAKAAIEARQSIIERAESLVEHNPEGFVEQNLTPDQQVRLATLLLARHFDTLVPIIQSYDANPSSRIATTAEAQLRIKEQTDDFHAHSAAQSAAAEVRKAVAALIPETVDQATAEQFWADASSDVQRAMARGEQVDPASVASILAPRLKLYGFASAGSVPAAPAMPRITLAPAAPGSSPVAQPANDAAKQLADAKAAQKRIRLRQQQRINAAAVPPAGAGAAPVRMPAVPSGSTIQEASKQLRKLGGGWAHIGNH